MSFQDLVCREIICSGVALRKSVIEIGEDLLAYQRGYLEEEVPADVAA